MELTTSFNHTVKSYECGPDGKLRLHNLLLLLQEAAYLNAEKLDFGYGFLIEKNMTWVLSSLKIKIKEHPKWTDKVELQTWPIGYNRLYGLRDFLLLNDKGEELMAITSEWVIIDAKTRRPVNIYEQGFNLPRINKRAMEEDIKRLNPKRFAKAEQLAEITVPYSAIDENGHVNNAEYVKWALDAFKQKGNAFDSFSKVQISFIAEIFENSKCIINKHDIPDGSTLLSGVNPLNGNYVFALQLS